MGVQFGCIFYVVFDNCSWCFQYIYMVTDRSMCMCVCECTSVSMIFLFMLCAWHITYTEYILYIFYGTISMSSSSSSHIDLLPVLGCARYSTPLYTMKLRFNRSDLGNLSTFYSNNREKDRRKKLAHTAWSQEKTTHEPHFYSIWSFFAAAVVVVWFPAAFYLHENCALIWYGIVQFFFLMCLPQDNILIVEVRLKFMHIDDVVVHNENTVQSIQQILFFVSQFPSKFICLKNHIEWCFDFVFFVSFDHFFQAICFDLHIKCFVVHKMTREINLTAGIQRKCK